MPANDGWELVVTPISSVIRQAVRWLWPGRLPIGKLTLLEGDPSVGKSWVTLAFTAVVASGAPFPIDSERRPPGRALIMTAEDGLADTVAPRLDAMGADTSRIEAIESAARPIVADREYAEMMERNGLDTQEHRAIFLSEDLGKVERVLSGRLYSLLVIDPINAYIPASIDSAKDNAVRSILAPLVTIADRYGVAVVAVRHLTKGSRDKAIYRGQGSIGYTAAARTVLLAGQEQNNGGRRVIMPIKCNLAPLADAVTYAIENGRFVWGIAAPGVKPQSVLGAEPEEERRSGTEEAGDLLVDFLAEGDQPASEAIKHVRQRLGCSNRTIERAKLDRHIVSQRRGFGRQSEMYWHLPKAVQGTLLAAAESKRDSAGGETGGENHNTPDTIGANSPYYGENGEYGPPELVTRTPVRGAVASMELSNKPLLDDPLPDELAQAAAEAGPPEDLSELDDDDTHY